MSIHADPRRNSLDEEEYREWQNDLKMEYAREIYEERHPYEDTLSEYFHGKCPYTNEPCATFECDECEVNAEEREYAESEDEEDG